MKIYENYSLQERHTFHLPVKTRYYIEYDTVNELCAFIKENSLFREYSCYHIGGGSNLLFYKITGVSYSIRPYDLSSVWRRTKILFYYESGLVSYGTISSNIAWRIIGEE